MTAFEVLVKSNLNQEVMRSLSLYITYAFHTPSSSVSRTPRALSSISRSTTPVPERKPTVEIDTGTNEPNTKYLTKKQLGKHVLIMYSSLLCDKENTEAIKKFAKTVTNKVRL
jgi:beige protein homolog 1